MAALQSYQSGKSSVPCASPCTLGSPLFPAPALCQQPSLSTSGHSSSGQRFARKGRDSSPQLLPASAKRSVRVSALDTDNRSADSGRRRPTATAPGGGRRSTRPHAGRGDGKGSVVVENPGMMPRQPLSLPLSTIDVDAELWQVLDLCSDEELEAVYSVLHAPSPFSPVVKSLVTENEPPLVEQRGRLSLMHKIESRFRFLAADQSNLLRGTRPTYRDTLLSIRDRIEVPCSTNLSTFDLETEVFLHVLNNCLEYVQEGESEGTKEAAARATMQEGDGMANASAIPRRPNWVERVTAPIMFGVKELVPTLAKLGSAITVTAVGRSTATQLAKQLAVSHLRYQAAARCVAAAAQRGVTSGALAAGWGRQAMLESAAKGLQAATARYSALQGALSFIGPIMWGWLAVDLAFKAIGTDYARVIRAVFILAQVRLLRTNGFTNPAPAGQVDTLFTATSSTPRDPGSYPVGPVVVASQSDDICDMYYDDSDELAGAGDMTGTGGVPGVGPGHTGGVACGKHTGAGGSQGSGHTGEEDEDPYTDCNNVYN